jgi:hypothetical protein
MGAKVVHDRQRLVGKEQVTRLGFDQLEKERRVFVLVILALAVEGQGGGHRTFRKH